MRNILFLFILLSVNVFFSQSLYTSEPLVRVRLTNTSDTIKIVLHDEWMLTGNGTAKIILAAGSEIIFRIQDGRILFRDAAGETVLPGNNFLLTGKSGGALLTMKDVPFGVGWWWQGKEDRVYAGDLTLHAASGDRFEVVIALPLEEYLKGVVPYEIGGDSPLEAVKAQAVAARSEAVTALQSKLYSGEHYDLTSDVECQVFGGNKKRTAVSDRAVSDTRGLILSENNSPMSAYYASNCGGHSELISNVWGNRFEWESYTVSGFDWTEPHSIDLRNEANFREWVLSSPRSFCNPAIYTDLPSWSKSNFRWKREFSLDEITTMTSGGKQRGKLLDILTVQRGISGRIYNAEFRFEKDTLFVEGELKIRQMFTPPLKSSAFVIDKTGSGFAILGAGWGHGVGMCQSGAVTMANLNKSFDIILKHYYKKSELIKMY